MKDNITPEEKLLRLIKGQKKQIDAKPAFTSVIKSEVNLKEKRKVKPSIYPLIQKYLSITYLRKIIGLVFLASCLYLIISFIYPWLGLKRIKLPQITAEKIIEPNLKSATEPKPYEFYLEGIKNRQIFRSSTSTGEAEKPIGAINIDFTKDISLVGIISGENPQAVIEDKKTQKTYYVSKGQFIGEFQVEDIQEGKIVLNNNGQRFELYL